MMSAPASLTIRAPGSSYAVTITMGTPPLRRLRSRRFGTVGFGTSLTPSPTSVSPSAGAAAGGVLLHEVMPGARRADLDLVTQHRLGPAAQRLELCDRSRTTPPGRK